MSSVHRSAISARIAQLPHLPSSDVDYDDLEEEENDSLGSLSLPSGMGPPAMSARLADLVGCHIAHTLRVGPLKILGLNLRGAHQMRPSPQYLPPHSSLKPSKSMLSLQSWTNESTTHHQSLRMELS
jgi:hypothetical protein